MYTPGKFFFALTSLFALVGVAAAIADDHVVVERARAGMGMRSPTRVSEIWLNETSVYTKGARFITIERYDVKKRWTLSPQTKRFFEEPLASPSEERKEPVAIQRAGWDYEPVYDWTVSEPQRTDTICGLRCRLVVADGDADYSSEAIELWVSEKSPVNNERFNQRVASPMADFDWQALAKVHPALNKLFVLKCIARIAHPIAPEMSYETTVTKLESASPPPGLYEIPEGFQRVNTVEELTK